MKYRHRYTVMYSVIVDIETNERDAYQVPDADIKVRAQAQLKDARPDDITVGEESLNLETNEYFNADDLDAIDEMDDEEMDDDDEDEPEEDDDEDETPDSACFKFETTDPYGTPIPGVLTQTMTLREFMDDNKEATEEAERMEELAVGDATMIGGGAAQGYRVTRIS